LLIASATWEGITLVEGLNAWKRQAVFLLNYSLAFALQLTESTENLSQGSRVAKIIDVALNWLPFEGETRWQIQSPSVGTSFF
jgi:hypothetical protein